MKIPIYSRIVTPIIFSLTVVSWAAAVTPDAVGGLTDEETNTIKVFKDAGPGVVHIEARAVNESRFTREETASGAGTGFVVDGQGHILTAFHVIENMNQVDVMFGSGLRAAAELVGTSPQLDIALLKVEAPEDQLHPLPMGDSGRLEVGQKVIAIGNPYGFHNSVTVGTVSAVERGVAGTPLDLQEALIQTDAAINPGNSGGPLLNSAGEVVGINTAMIKGAENMGFAIPIHLARRILPDLIEMGHPYRPQLGFSVSEISPSIAKLFGLPVDAGLLVEEVLPYSPAADAGLQAGERVLLLGEKVYVLGGDIIIEVNGRPVSSSAQVAKTLIESRPGEALRLGVYRQGRKEEITIPLKKMEM